MTDSQLTIFPPLKNYIKETIHLNGSKSISNRVLIIKSLAENSFNITNLSNAQDTVTLNQVLSNLTPKIDADAGGTTFRFLTSFLCTQPGKFILTGSERMKERPIKVLVEALNTLGANIQYLEKEGFPPLEIDGTLLKGGKIVMQGNISSQYLSSLLMIGPKLKGGLELEWEGILVSRPYLTMTLNLMAHFGARFEWKEQSVKVFEGNYIGKDYFVEGDWSAASYFYEIVALSKSAEINLIGLHENSVQGDAVIVDIMDKLGVKTYFNAVENCIKINKKTIDSTSFNYDFLDCPDLAQTLVALLTGLNIKATFKGLQTLKIKETDRVVALKNEMKKFGAIFQEENDHLWQLTFNEVHNAPSCSTISTYEDHRMAMAIAPLCLIFGALIILEPDVVNKSYPLFWNDLERLGFRIEKTNDFHLQPD